MIKTGSFSMFLAMAVLVLGVVSLDANMAQAGGMPVRTGHIEALVPAGSITGYTRAADKKVMVTRDDDCGPATGNLEKILPAGTMSSVSSKGYIVNWNTRGTNHFDLLRTLKNSR